MDRGSTTGRNKRSCVIIFASEDIELARTAVGALKSQNWDAWWSEDINHGDWETEVRNRIENCSAVVPIVTRNTSRKAIFTDEWRYADSKKKVIFPLVIDPSSIPFGMGGRNRTDAANWKGESSHPALTLLTTKMAGHFQQDAGSIARHDSLNIGGKSLQLPSFVYSLSSFETQLDPVNGLELLTALEPGACLVSAYDVSTYLHGRNKSFRRSIDTFQKSRSVVFLDSGNYEATRKGDYRSRKNADGWRRELFWEAVNSVSADIVFAYDDPEPKGTLDEVIDGILDSYLRDLRRTGLDTDTLCPIVHLPTEVNDITKSAPKIVAAISKESRPSLIAIPERELGDGLLSRMRAVKAIRHTLNDLGYYQPLHILGTGNPITIAALSICGADTFDGLEWCRTAANFETNNLCHFQQFDLLKASFGGRIKNEAARSIAELESAPFTLRACSYNYDYFSYWIGHVQHWIHSPNPEGLFQSIPYLGAQMTKEYLS
jgi:queuine/archaeosine tRNA-ribosyltransferase